MKKGILYLFLFTYSTVMLKSVVPYLTDIIAHVLFFKDHMATVHAHHGKFHVHTAITEAAKNDQSEKSTNNLKKDNVVTDHIFIDSYRVPVQLASKNYFYSLSIPTSTTDVRQDYPPPRVSSPLYV